MKRTQKAEWKYKTFKIIKDTDYWGNWEYILLNNNNFMMRHFDFNKCKEYALRMGAIL